MYSLSLINPNLWEAGIAFLFPFIPLPSISVAIIKTNEEFCHIFFVSSALDKTSASDTEWRNKC